MRFPNWSADKALEVMDRNGISTSVISISAPGVYFRDKDPSMEFARGLSRKTNEICAGLIENHPERFGAFATLPLPDVDAALEELEYALDVLKLDGVFLYRIMMGIILVIRDLKGYFPNLTVEKWRCSFIRLHPLASRKYTGESLNR